MVGKTGCWIALNGVMREPSLQCGKDESSLPSPMHAVDCRIEGMMWREFTGICGIGSWIHSNGKPESHEPPIRKRGNTRLQAILCQRNESIPIRAGIPFSLLILQ
ncbi:MAG: hypothetical protein LR011_04810 [Verrucomicrobia bacterium]|nr:hypothetical protein [Verrucomicrobiota bacterium]